MAHALTDEEIERLKTLSEIGAEACQKSDYETCLRMFTQANSLLDYAPHYFYIGEALVGSGRMLEGVATWQKLLRDNAGADDPMVQQFISAAQRRLDEEAPEVPTLMLDVSTEHRGLVEVRIDDEKVEPERVSKAIQLDPGKHVIEFAQAGYLREREQLLMRRGERQSLRVALEPLQPTPPVEPPPPRRDEVVVDDDDDGSWVFPAGITLAAVGLGAGVGGAVAYSLKEIRRDELEQACQHQSPCQGLSPTEFDAWKARVEERTVVSNVLIFGGAGLFLAGGGLLLWDLAGDDDEVTERGDFGSSRDSLQLGVAPGGVSLHGRF